MASSFNFDISFNSLIAVLSRNGLLIKTVFETFPINVNCLICSSFKNALIASTCPGPYETTFEQYFLIH